MDKLLKMIEAEIVMAERAVKAKIWTLALAHYFGTGQMLNVIWTLQASGQLEVTRKQETVLAAFSVQVTDGLRRVGRLGGNGQHNPGDGIKGQAEELYQRLHSCFPK
jgi:hypothetical protein